MKLNTLSPALGSKKNAVRVGRGIGSGLGKTCGKGHKGQKARAGGYHKVGFEGGQMPLQRRLPKFGFRSAKSRVTGEMNVSNLQKLESVEITLELLKQLDLVQRNIQRVKLIGTHQLTRAYSVRGLLATQSAKKAIESAGGSIEE